jgi:adenylylsulfate kinase-like enzyme
MIKEYSGKIIWFTGLSGVGKTTLSNYLIIELKKKKFKIKKIDGDTFRKKNRTIKKFSKKHIIKNNKNIINYVKKNQHLYDFILISAISPLVITRRLARKKFNEKYFEIYVFCKIKTLINRDTKGLYKKVIKKRINNLIGFRSNIKYEKSNYNNIKINTDKLTIEDSIKIILKKINS